MKFLFCFSYRWEAVPVFVEGLRLEIRAQRRTDSSLPQTHGRPAIPVPSVRTGLLAVRSPGPAHETSHQRLIFFCLQFLSPSLKTIFFPNVFSVVRFSLFTHFWEAALSDIWVVLQYIILETSSEAWCFIFTSMWQCCTIWRLPFFFCPQKIFWEKKAKCF